MRRLLALGTGIAASILALALWQSVERLDDAEAWAAERVRLETFEANRKLHIVLEGARLTLDTIAAEIRVSADGALVLDARLDRVIDTALAGNPFATGAILRDAEGRIVATGAPRVGLGRRGDEIDFFQAAMQGARDPYLVGAPFHSAVFNAMLLPLARAVRGGDGAVAGVIAVGVPIEAIHGAIAPSPAIEGARARLWRQDETLLANAPDDGLAAGRRHPDLPMIAQRRTAGADGFVVARSPVSGTRRIAAWRDNFVYPVFVSVVAEEAPLLRSARIQIAGIAALAFLAIALGSAAAWLARARARRRDAMLAEIEAARAEAIRARDAAEATARAKTDLLAKLSHELRTPLNAVIGFNDMVRLGYSGPVTERARANLDLIDKAGQHLNRMIGTMLEMSRLELDPTALLLGWHDPRVALAEAAALAGALAAPRDVAVIVDADEPPALAICDRTRVVQAALNLLANAVRHSPDGGTVRAALDKVPGGFAIRIEDSGPGMKAERLIAAFEPFGAHPHIAEKRDGVGLGLAITRQIARAHGGDVVLANRAEGGLRAVLLIFTPGQEKRAA
ncbi:MAG: ATP-binding protein [Tagaea sp.]|nr:ATP-binding protein [Tagaea sp.]